MTTEMLNLHHAQGQHHFMATPEGIEPSTC
jgi:hypothetical protein